MPSSSADGKDYKLGGAAALGTSPNAVRDPGSGPNMFYVGTDRKMHDFIVTAGWQDFTIGSAVIAP